MRPQVINDYFKMQEEGLVPKILCGNDKQHGRPFLRVEDDQLELFCLACDYKVRPGLLMYQKMVNYMSIHDIDYLKELL